MNRAEKRRLAKQARKQSVFQPSHTPAPPSTNIKRSKRPQASPEQLYAMLRHAHDLYNQRRTEEARLAYHAILEIDKSYPDAHNSLGIIEAEKGHAELAELWFDKAIKGDPNRPTFHNNRGIALLEINRAEAAAGCFKAALKADASFVPAMCNLGKAYNKLGAPKQAIPWLEKTIVKQPDFWAAYMELAAAFGELGEFEKGVETLEKVLDVKGDDIQALQQLAGLFVTYGKLDEAIAVNRKILKINPNNIGAYLGIARVKKFDSYDEDIQAMEAHYAKIPDVDYAKVLSGEKNEQADKNAPKMNLAMSLAKAFESIKQYDKAFKFYQEANRLKRKQYAYSQQDVFRDFDLRRKVFTPAMIAEFRGCGDPDPTPIFIVGMPRSGTTLLEQVFHSHRDVFGAGELKFIGDLARDAFKSIEVFEQAYQQGKITPDMFRDMGKAYIEKVREISPDSPFITDKMPHNFLHVGFIKLALPNAKVIHSFRNPIDNCFAIFKQIFGNDGHQYGYDLVELGYYHNKYRELMAHWDTVFAGEILENRYEDMVADLEGQTRRVLDFCGLEWDENCLNFHEAERAVRTASVTQVRQPIYKSSVEKWRKYEKQLQPLIRALEKGPAF